jgi:hypothetical protein
MSIGHPKQERKPLKKKTRDVDGGSIRARHTAQAPSSQHENCFSKGKNFSPLPGKLTS